METKRPEVHLPDETEERVKQYAEERGLKMARAYYELLTTGLTAEEARPAFDDTAFGRDEADAVSVTDGNTNQ